MPQCTYRRPDEPYGKGSLHADLLEVTFRTRRRAARINEGENSRFNTYFRILAKNQANQDERNKKVMNRMRKTIEEIEAYKNVLQNYKLDTLNTIKWGFTPKDIPPTPKSVQRYKLENRLYQWGYSMQTFKPEVRNQIEKNKPGQRREKLQKQLLETARKRSNFLIDRKTTNEAMRRENWTLALKVKDTPEQEENDETYDS